MSYRRVLGKNDGGAHCVDVPDAFTLKGSTRVTLQPGEEKEITFTIKPEDLQFFDDSKHQWVVEPGKFKAYVSSSSADVRNTVEFEYL